MPRSYCLSTSAERDLGDIFSYTLTVWGPEQLTRYQTLIEEALERLVQNPTCPGSRDRDELFPQCRAYYVGKHVILYRVRAEMVEVASIL